MGLSLQGPLREHDTLATHQEWSPLHGQVCHLPLLTGSTTHTGMNAGWRGLPYASGVTMQTNPSHNLWGDEEDGLVHSFSDIGRPLLLLGYFLLK